MRTNNTKYIRINFSKCHACWHCVEACPKNVLGKINIPIHKHVHIDNPEDCIGCMKCINNCKNGAIEKMI